MADARLRSLERAARAGDVAARARLLAERVRLGRLARDRVELAAHLGDPAAALVVGVELPAGPLGPWAAELRRWGHEACARVALATATAMLPVWEAWEPGVYAPGVHLRWAVRAGHELLASRDQDERWRVAEGALLAAEEAVERTRHHLAAVEAEHPAKVGRASWCAADAGWVLVCAVRAAQGHLQRPPRGRTVAWALDQCPADVAPPAALRALLAAALSDWVLGESAPADGAGLPRPAALEPERGHVGDRDQEVAVPLGERVGVEQVVEVDQAGDALAQPEGRAQDGADLQLLDR